ncbi:MAG TPA: SCO6880 family protein [Solirubrobacteraceae bacterium]|nr:SCO6880 family protein [Solirubrobacteraceae bacterium]
MIGERVFYRFGPLERRGIFGAIRPGQAIVILAGGLAAIGVLDQAPSALGAVIATGLFGLAVLVAVAPVARRTAQEWGPIAASFLGRRSLGRTWFRSPGPASGSRQAKPPPALREVTIAQAPYRDRSIGVISERRGKRLTAVLACRVVSFTLLDPEAQERRLARWGLVLSGAAATAVRRIQWIERTVPAQGDELARWVAAERDPHIPLRGTPLIDSYLELIDTTARVTQEHEILVAVQVDAARVRDRGSDGVTRALIEQTERLAQGLEAAEVSVLGALSPGQLARATRTAFDPYSGSELAVLETADPERDGLPEAEAWPVGCQESWEHYRSDGALHTTYWIGAWPRVEVSPMFMDALLGRSSAVRTVAVTLEPIPIDRSTRDAEAAVTRDQADRELRRRFGQSDTARQRQAEEATVRRESELAAGHGEVRFAGFITVTGRDPDDLRRACAEVHEHAARARLELHRMYGQQADAFTFTLPLCRGLR